MNKIKELEETLEAALVVLKFNTRAIRGLALAVKAILETEYENDGSVSTTIELLAEIAEEAHID